MKTIGFFNTKGGVGTTWLVYHVAWMLAQLGVRVVAADLDPQASLSATFLDRERLAALWQAQPQSTIFGAALPRIVQTGDIGPLIIEPIDDNIGLLVGALELSQLEDRFAEAWYHLDPANAILGDVDRDRWAVSITNVFHQLISLAGHDFAADVALVDVGPNLAALNRAALLACDAFVVPLGADLFSIQSLHILGPKLRGWRLMWSGLRKHDSPANKEPLGGDMKPAGYVVIRHAVSVGGSPRMFARQVEDIPAQYTRSVLNMSAGAAGAIDTDPNCLAVLRDYRSLQVLAEEAHKPMFLLRPADGAFGGHQKAVQECAADFDRLARRIMRACGMTVPPK